MSNITIAENKYKQKIAFPSDDHIGNAIVQEGIYDSRGLRYIEHLLANLSQPIVFDIGANIGNHALVMAKYSKMVYLFEPQPNIAQLLQQTMALNNLTNWQIFEFGLADKAETLVLYKNIEGNNGASTFIPELKSKNFEKEELQVYRGDDIVDKNHINQLDFIKIDVEGFEAKVILGLKNSITKLRPILVIEWNNDITKKQFKELDLFNQVFKDYLIKAIVNNHHKSHWHNKWLGKLRRFFYKAWTKKRWRVEDFIENYNYQHVLLIPQEKAHVLIGL
jgi:FkbM family methyltransferase